MSRIKIKYFGPIKETIAATDGWIDILVSLHLSESVTQQYVGEKTMKILLTYWKYNKNYNGK